MQAPETIEVLQTIKNLLDERGLSYSTLAKHLNLSLSSVKRLMNSQDISLGRIIAICDLIGVDLQEVLRLQSEQSDGLFTFTEDQEQYFAKAPHFLAYLYELAANADPGQIEKKWNISKSSTKKYLGILQSLGLTTISDGKVILKFKGTFSWNDNGTLGRTFSKLQIMNFSKHVTHQLGLPNNMLIEFSSWVLTESNFSELKGDLKILSKKFRQLSRFNTKSIAKDQLARYTFVGMADRWYKAPYRTVIEI
jgi:transcriptional regulator with XRE-family HTH domain